MPALPHTRDLTDLDSGVEMERAYRRIAELSVLDEGTESTVELVHRRAGEYYVRRVVEEAGQTVFEEVLEHRSLMSAADPFLHIARFVGAEDDEVNALVNDIREALAEEARAFGQHQTEHTHIPGGPHV